MAGPPDWVATTPAVIAERAVVVYVVRGRPLIPGCSVVRAAEPGDLWYGPPEPPPP
jgi:hypothetical protein